MWRTFTAIAALTLLVGTHARAATDASPAPSAGARRIAPGRVARVAPVSPSGAWSRAVSTHPESRALQLHARNPRATAVIVAGHDPIPMHEVTDAYLLSSPNTPPVSVVARKNGQVAMSTEAPALRDEEGRIGRPITDLPRANERVTMDTRTKLLFARFKELLPSANVLVGPRDRSSGQSLVALSEVAEASNYGYGWTVTDKHGNKTLFSELNVADVRRIDKQVRVDRFDPHFWPDGVALKEMKLFEDDEWRAQQARLLQIMPSADRLYFDGRGGWRSYYLSGPTASGDGRVPSPLHVPLALVTKGSFLPRNEGSGWVANLRAFSQEHDGIGSLYLSDRTGARVELDPKAGWDEPAAR